MNKILTHKWFHQSLILFVILAAAWLRLWQLYNLPPGFWYDEAYNAMDAIWMLDTRSPTVHFIQSNSFREPLLLYLGAFSMALFGPKPYTFRLVSVFTGILTIPLMYRWLLNFFVRSPNHRWLALMAAAGLAFAFWHVTMSRIGFRVVFFPAFVIVTTYLFWSGWQQRSLIHFVAAGVAMGVAQYTYLAARFLPLLFLGFALVSLVFLKDWSSTSSPTKSVSTYFQFASSQKVIWIGLVIMGVFSFIVFVPLGLLFYYNPTYFGGRTNTVSIWRYIDNPISFIQYLISGLQVFTNGYDQNWRHDLPGRIGLGWFSLGGFWLGLLICARHFRTPTHLFLLTGLFILWLPAILSDQAIHTLRLSGMLPIYYTIVSIGLVTLGNLIAKKIGRQFDNTIKLAIFALIIIFSGGFTGYDYFVRWAKEPMTYQEHNGPLADLAQDLIKQSRSVDILLPFSVYSQPTVRFLLYEEFQEVDEPPPIPTRPALLVTSKPALAKRLTNVKSSSYVWLTRDRAGQGILYVSRQQWPTHSSMLQPSDKSDIVYNPYTQEAVAQVTPLKNVAPVQHLFTEWPAINSVNYDVGHQFRLIGYQISPNSVQPGQEITLNLYWQILNGKNFWEYILHIEILNHQGIVVEKLKTSSKELFRWRQNGYISSYRSSGINHKALPGTYSIRIALVAPEDKRLSVYTPQGELPGNQIMLGTFDITLEANNTVSQ